MSDLSPWRTKLRRMKAMKLLRQLFTGLRKLQRSDDKCHLSAKSFRLFLPRFESANSRESDRKCVWPPGAYWIFTGKPYWLNHSSHDDDETCVS